MFTDNTIVYVENRNELTKKLLELTNNYTKFAGYKVNIQKLVTILYTSNEIRKRKKLSSHKKTRRKLKCR